MTGTVKLAYACCVCTCYFRFWITLVFLGQDMKSMIRVTIPNKRPAPPSSDDDDTLEHEPKRQLVVSAHDNLRIKVPRFPRVPPSVSNATQPLSTSSTIASRIVVRPGSRQNPLEIRDDNSEAPESKLPATVTEAPRQQQQPQFHLPGGGNLEEELAPVFRIFSAKESQNQTKMAALVRLLHLAERMAWTSIQFPPEHTQRAEQFKTELSRAVTTFGTLYVAAAQTSISGRDVLQPTRVP
jgi:hypothetical protein